MLEMTLTIPVKTNAETSPEEVAKIVERLLDIGLADAPATLEDDGNEDAGDVKAAQLATDLSIGAPVVASAPRVLVIVRGGVADHVCDKGVDVEIFDWDNYEAEEEANQVGVPKHFSDLAGCVLVPCEGDDDE